MKRKARCRGTFARYELGHGLPGLKRCSQLLWLSGLRSHKAPGCPAPIQTKPVPRCGKRRSPGVPAQAGDIFPAMHNYKRGHRATSIGTQLLSNYRKYLAAYERAWAAVDLPAHPLPPVCGAHHDLRNP